MTPEQLRETWKREEQAAHIHGWDFSHIRDRYEEEHDLPWDYDAIVRARLDREAMLLDYDTGGGEYLLALEHPCHRTAATEGWPPNVELCRQTLVPLGIDFRPCHDPSTIPFGDSVFDRMINRHGSFDPREIHRVLRQGGIFTTEQVGEDNDRDLVEQVLPGLEKPFPGLNLERQRRAFEEAGFEILDAREAFRPILFYDIGAFVWFARVIPWEFPDFSVDRCFDRLMRMHRTVQRDGMVKGTIHRFLIVARKR